MGSDLAPPPRFVGRTGLIAILALAAIAMVLGSMFDLPLSTAVYDPDSWWGTLLAAIGEWPMGTALIVAGVFLIRSRPPGPGRISRAILATVVLVIGTGVVVIIPAVHSSAPTPAVLGGGAVLAVMVIGGTWALTRGASPSVLAHLGAGLILIVVTELLVITLMKAGWGRPRMRMLSANPDYGFNPWWTLGSQDRPDALAGGIRAEEFRSFPSGHTANAAVAMYLLPALAWASGRWRSLTGAGLAIGFAWAVWVAASRIVVGAHFLTDVTVGLVVTTLIIVTAQWALDRRRDGRILEQVSKEDP